MSFSPGSAGGPVANINVTPLVDVMLVLLVIFMVTAPMMQQGVEVNLPKAETGALSGEDEQIVVSIDAAGAVFVGSKNEIPVSELAEKIKAIFAAKKSAGQKVYVKADEAIDYGAVMGVMSALYTGGITQVGLVTDLPSPPEIVPESKLTKDAKNDAKDTAK